MNERMNVFKVTLSHVITVAGALMNRRYSSRSVVMKMGAVMSGHQTMPWTELFEIVPKRVQRRDSLEAPWHWVRGTRRCHWKARSPIVDRRVDGTVSVDVLADRRRRRASTSVVNRSSEVSRRGKAASCYGGSDGPEHTTGI